MSVSPTSDRTPLWAMSKRQLLFIVEDDQATFERRMLASEELKERGVELTEGASDLTERISAYSAAAS